MLISIDIGSNKSHPKHGMYNTPTYHTWEGMKQRCLNPKATRYPDYGANGIIVCDKWLSFEGFLEDMGVRPKDMTLDRINPHGDYTKENCRWATRKEQQNNQKRHFDDIPKAVPKPIIWGWKRAMSQQYLRAKTGYKKNVQISWLDEEGRRPC